MKLLHLSAAMSVALLYLPAFAQNPGAAVPCPSGSAVTGVVHDSSGAVVAAAAVSLDEGSQTGTTAQDGRFRFACVPSGAHVLHVAAETFAAADIALPRNRTDIAVTLQPDTVAQSVQVDADATAKGVDNHETGAARTLKGDDLKSLAEDPDDLLRELQQMTAGAGSNPATAIITVDGFQDNATLPPKASIAYIRVNPDLFSAEYQEPPFEGGRVEVYTKPGQPRFHGALAAIYGGTALNARDPFSVSGKGKLGKERFDAELSGPIRKQGSDFSLELQHRSIDEVAVVDAVSLDAAGNEVSTTATVPQPQQRWDGNARTSWQLGPRNLFIASLNSYDDTEGNMGVGGTTLQEAGYDLHRYEHVARLTDVTTVSANTMHEARVSFRFADNAQTPHSTAPGLQVAGSFTGGGSETGAQDVGEFGLEVIDDVIATRGAHTLKIGTDVRTYRENERMTQDFNGMYNFGGGTAAVLDANGNAVPGQTTTITGLEQYRRAVLGFPGGAATAYIVVTGTPLIHFVQTRAAIYVQDDWKLRPNVLLSFGLRYALQNNPATYQGATPRLGIAWSPDKKQNWTLKAHAGLFSGRYTTEDETELRRLDGVQRTMSTIYSPVFNNPFQSATPIGTVRTSAPQLTAVSFQAEAFEVDHSLGKGWNVSGAAYWIHVWNDVNSRNINSPLNSLPTGPRPSTANLNILRAENDGTMGGDIQFLSLSQQSNKFVTFFVGYARIDLRGNTDDSLTWTPQSSTTDAGEYGRRTQQAQHNVFGNATGHLPWKTDLSLNASIASGHPYNVITGFDNNGDGDFNDRPTYATPGDPDAIATRFGSLVLTGGTGVFPRNAGTMPWQAHVDANLERSFTLTPHAATDHAQKLLLNVRSANVLNYTNVTTVGNVLGSPLFATPYAAEAARRIEVGARYSF